MSAAAGRKGDSNDNRTALHKSRRVVLGRNVSRVRGDGCTLQGRQRETGRRAGDNDLPKWPFLPGADREPNALRMGRPINAWPAGGSSASFTVINWTRERGEERWADARRSGQPARLQIFPGTHIRASQAALNCT